MMNEAKFRKIINILREHLQEEMPTMSVGHGKIAGTVEAGDDPPVRKKKKKNYASLGVGSRKNWLDYCRSATNAGSGKA